MPGDLLQYRKRKRLKRRRRSRSVPLTIEQILAWADAHRLRTGSWPTVKSGCIRGVADGTWNAVDNALRKGRRGLPTGSSIARLLEANRGVRNPRNLPDLNVRQILGWADAYYASFGDWPSPESGPISNWPLDTWSSLESALRIGMRGLPGGSSLARLLAKHRGRRNRKALPPFSIDDILSWADRHRREKGKWPNQHSGPIAWALGDTWGGVDAALDFGFRGLPGGSSLARLLVERRGIRSKPYLPRLTPKLILTWTDAHHRRHGLWPTEESGVIPDTNGETWMAVTMALSKGLRGLPGGTTLARFLAKHRAVGLRTNKSARIITHRNRIRESER